MIIGARIVDSAAEETEDLPAGVYCSMGHVRGSLDVVCLVARAWLTGQAGGLGANAVTEDRAVGVLVCVFGTVRYDLGAEGRVGMALICPWCMPIQAGRPEDESTRGPRDTDQAPRVERGLKVGKSKDGNHQSQVRLRHTPARPGRSISKEQQIPPRVGPGRAGAGQV